MSRRVSKIGQATYNAVTATVREPGRRQLCRSLSYSPIRQTDGVFRELNETLVQIPWIEAFRKRQSQQQQDPLKQQAEVERDLTPKPMSASYHSIVRICC